MHSSAWNVPSPASQGWFTLDSYLCLHCSSEASLSLNFLPLCIFSCQRTAQSETLGWLFLYVCVFIFIYLKGRVEVRAKDLPSTGQGKKTGTSSRSPPGVAGAQATWAIICCLPGGTRAKLDWRQSIQDLNQHSGMQCGCRKWQLNSLHHNAHPCSG